MNHTVAWKLNATATNGTSALFNYAIITVEDPVPIPSASASQCVAPHSQDSPSTHHPDALTQKREVRIPHPHQTSGLMNRSPTPTPRRRKAHKGIIAGAIIATLGAAVIIVGGLCFILSRRRKARASTLSDTEDKPRSVHVRANYVVQPEPFPALSSAGDSHGDPITSQSQTSAAQAQSKTCMSVPHPVSSTYPLCSRRYLAKRGVVLGQRASDE